MTEEIIQRGVAEIMRDEMVMRDKIIAVLQDGPKTIVEIAESLGCPSHEVMYWVMAMWRYGRIEETAVKPDDDGYFKYRVK
ncbi:MAG TPA: MarR family transcriptional regulator [Bacteroidetes bacterium]|nr:MarR family transcriptional regulator [Bacteroidota bacterium]